MAADRNSFANLIWKIADLLLGSCRLPQFANLASTSATRLLELPIAVPTDTEQQAIAAHIDVGAAA